MTKMFYLEQVTSFGTRALGSVRRWTQPGALALALLAAGMLAPPRAQAELSLYSDDFEGADLNTRWSLTGDWRFRTPTNCLDNNEVSYASPFTSLVFDYGSSCAYANNRAGFATLVQDIALPLSNPNVTLKWKDYVGAELGADYYFVQVSTDGGVTWPYEVFRDSKDKKFWGEEEVDLSPFVGKTVRVRFGFTSDATVTGKGWYIDDVRIVAEDLPAGVSAVAIVGGSVQEGNSGETPLTFTVLVSPANANPITIERATVSGTALAGLDFVGSSGPLTIPANTTSFPLDIQVRGDAFNEGDETFSVQISNPSPNAVIAAASAEGTIIDDESLTCSYTEDFEPRPGTFRWTTGYPPNPSSEPAVIGQWHIQENSNCLSPLDGFHSSTHAMVFNTEGTCTYDDPAGTNAADFDNPVTYVRMINSELIPGTNALNAQLSFYHHLSIAYTAIQAQKTTARVEVSESGNLGPWKKLREFAPSEPSTTNFEIPWREETISLNEYVGKPVMIRFVFSQPVENDPAVATGWYIDDFKICYGPRPAGVSKVKIGDVDPNRAVPLPTDATALEGTAATNVMTFPVTIDPAPVTDITLSYETVGLSGTGAATPDSDYISTIAQVVIPAGTTSTTLDVLLVGDDEPEVDESFQIKVTPVSSNVFLVNQTATGIIDDDDTPSTFDVSVNGVTGTPPQIPEALGTALVVVTISQARTVPITLNYQTIDDTAVSGTGLDYIPASGKITFPPNTTTQTFPITILNDTVYEDADLSTPLQHDMEHFFVKLSSDSPYAQTDPAGTEMEIVDDDAPDPAVSLLTMDNTAGVEGSCAGESSEENCGTPTSATFTIALNHANVNKITLDYTTVDGTATAGDDYVAKSGTVTFNPGESSKDIVVDIIADRKVEGIESFQLVLSNPLSPGAPKLAVNVINNAATCTISDDDFSGEVFGMNGDRVQRRGLFDVVSTPFIDKPTQGGPLDLTAAEFRGNDYSTLYGFVGTEFKTIQLFNNLVTSLSVTGAVVPLPNVMSALAWDPTNGEMYAASTEGKLYTINVDTAVLTLRGSVAEKIVALAVHPTTGRIYAVTINGTDANLYSVIPGNWTFNPVGTISGLTPGDTAKDALWSADFDDSTALLYVNAYTNASQWVMREVNVDTAASKLILRQPDFSSLAIASAPPVPDTQWTSDYRHDDRAPGGLDFSGASDGTAVSVGDVNSDTFDDYLITSPSATVGSFANAGKAFLLYGGPNGAASQWISQYLSKAVSFESLLDGANGVLFQGHEADEALGVAAAGLGDINGDKIADFGVSYLGADGRGGVYILYGSRNPALPATISTANIGSGNGKVPGVWVQGSQVGDFAGGSLSGAGDLNSDGLADIIIGAPAAANKANPSVHTGAAYVIFGSATGLGSNGLLELQALDSYRGVTINGEAANNQFGSRVSGAGDVNGDGIDDILIAAPGRNANQGAAYIVYGHVDFDAVSPTQSVVAPTYINLAQGTPFTYTNTIPPRGGLNNQLLANQIPGRRIIGEGGSFGTVAKGIGDFDGDSRDDILLSAPNFDGSSQPTPHWGRVYIVKGQSSPTDPNNASAGAVGTNPLPGTILLGVDQFDETGAGAAGVGDINGDGLMDVVIGAYGGGVKPYSGEAYLIYGSSALSGQLSLRDLAGTDTQPEHGTYLRNTEGGATDSFGRTVSGGGDLDDDGIADFIIGHETGAYVFLGASNIDQAVYRNRMRSGNNVNTSAGDPKGGDLVTGRVGTTGDGAITRPTSRVKLAFKGGGTGSTQDTFSTQEVTLFRKPSPDLAVGSGTAEDDARWIPGGVYWKVQTDRTRFSESHLTFYYRPAEIQGLGLDPSKLSVYYAKPDSPPTSTTSWTLLSVAYDPDRGALVVDRVHNDLDKAQEEFNGYYAVVQANFFVELGQNVPSVGLGASDVYAGGPDVTPSGLTYWHTSSKRLYAVAPGKVRVTWKNGAGVVTSSVDVTTDWPQLASGQYQPYIANSTAVPLDVGGAVTTPFQQLMSADTTLAVGAGGINPADEVKTNKRFYAGLNSTATSTTARVLLMLSDKGDAAAGSLYFQFVNVFNWNNGTVHYPSSINFEIGKALTPATDAVYQQYHDEAAGSPFVLDGIDRYAPASARYPGLYDRSSRTGSIVFVNTVNSGSSGTTDRSILVYYQRGTKLIEARTGQTLKEGTTSTPVKSYAWPYYTAQYAPKWPTANDNNTIIVSKQNGSQEISPATYGLDIDLYVQNTKGQAGFNPNEEHALIAPYGSGKAVFALRNDLNSAATGDPWVLMTYYDPADLDVNGNPRAKMKPWYVVQSTSQYPFSNWPNINPPTDPFEGTAGQLVLPPYPLSVLRISQKNQVIGDVGWIDRNKSVWAVGEGELTLRLYYPVQPDFYFPQAYLNRFGGSPPSSTVDVPFLDGGIGGSGTPVPGDVKYTTKWPADAPTMNFGEVLIEARQGLPQINGQCSVGIVYPPVDPVAANNPVSAELIDPVQPHSVDLDEVPLDVDTALSGSDITFPKLPPALGFRITYNQQSKKLTCTGRIVDPVAGFDYPLLNVLTTADRDTLKSLSTDTKWDAACDALYNASKDVVKVAGCGADTNVDCNKPTCEPATPYALALSTGNAHKAGYVALALQNACSCAPLPVSIAIIRVTPNINPGTIAVVKPACVFDEFLTMMSTNDYGGKPENYTFEWKTVPDEDGTMPALPDATNPANWVTPDLGPNNPSGGDGVSQVTIKGPGLLTLTDNWFTMRYKRKDGLWGANFSAWTSPQLAPGWIKRVVGQINPFNQRAGGGGIAGAEAQFASFSSDAPNTIANMLSLAGPRYGGAVPLNCDDLDAFGLIPIYSTVLDRGATLSINALPPIDNPNVNNALILAASRINDLYMLLGNEAYADAADPTIAFGTDDGEYGAQATSLHPFMNQTSSLLEEELALLRGRDDTYSPGVQTDPFYNKLVWNFTKDATGGEVAYALNYNILDAVDGGDGVISEADAKRLYPQGHGDAWGHYLTAMTTYYKLLRHPYFSWVTRSEGYLVGGQPVTVDYYDERKFARSAAAKARAGAEIVNLQYRDGYVENPEGLWQGLKDSDTVRKWGFAEWAERAGQGTYLDWAVGNAILPAVDPNPAHTGITKIDRTTVADLNEVSAAYTRIQAQADTADLGLNPLGLGVNAIPFDISPNDVDDGLTHFEQIYGRAQAAVNNAVTAFDNANNSTQLLRRQADSEQSFQRDVQDQEIDFNARLIELFGTPYSDDIGPGGSYPRGYDGPDLFHYMYHEESPLLRDGQVRNLFFSASSTQNNQNDIPSATLTTLTNAGLVVGDGDLAISVDVKNYGLLPYNSPITQGASIMTQPTSQSGAVNVKFNLALDSDGQIGLAKPTSWHGTRRATGELQNAQTEVLKNLGDFVTSIKDYRNYLDDIDTDISIIQTTYNVKSSEITFKAGRNSDHETLSQRVFALRTSQIVLQSAADIIEAIGKATEKSVPTVTGLIAGLAAGVVIDGLAPVRGGLSAGVSAAIAVIKTASNVLEIGALEVEKQDDWADRALELNLERYELNLDTYNALKELEKTLRGELQLRVAMYNQYENLVQSIQNYSTVQTNASILLDQLDIFRKRVSSDVQGQRYKDMAFRIFRDDQLQKYRAQFDLAARYTYLAAKAYDYDTTMLSTDPNAGQRFLTDIVKQRQIGTVTDGESQPGTGIANALAIMARNFSVLSGQLGFNNPQVETNRFSLRYELFRVLNGPNGDQAWNDLLNQDYFTKGVGKVDNLWDVPEFVQNCVPPADFGATEPGLVIPFSTTVTEGKNFFGKPAGGFDNSYDSTQFATKIRNVGIWFSDYDFFDLSNTPRVWLIPAGTDILRSPTGAAGLKRYFNVLDQVLPIPYPIGTNDLASPEFIPSVDGLSGQLTPIRRFGRLRAYSDSGQFDPAEVNSDSRLIGRSVWNTKWMLIIPGSTFKADSADGLETFINGPLTNGNRTGNGVSDIKVFFETYAYPRVKSAEPGKGEKEVTVDVATKN